MFDRRYAEQLIDLRRAKLCYETVLLNPDTLTEFLQFITFVFAYLLHLAQPPGGGRGPPVVFQACPEYILVDITDYLLFVGMVSRAQFDRIDCKPIVKFMATLLGNKSYISNPETQAKFVEFLSLFTIERGCEGPSAIFNAMSSDPQVVSLLCPALVQFYGETESADPYSKVTKRYYMMLVLKNLWLHPAHRDALVTESGLHNSSFLKFGVLLISDALALFDDGR